MLVIFTFRITGFDFTYGRPAFSAAPPTVQLMFVSSTYRITELNYTYVNATLSAAYVGYLYLQNHRASLYLWLSSLNRSLCSRAEKPLIG